VGGPVLLLLLVATGQGQDPATVALIATLEESIGTQLTVRVVESTDPSDADALRLQREQHANAVAVVTWRDPEHLGAEVRMRTAAGWYRRTIAFKPQDASAEKGRTLGLVMVAMGNERPPDEPKPATPESPVAAAEPAGAPAPRASAPAKPAAEAEPPTVSKARESAAPAGGAWNRFGIGAAGVGALGAGGPGAGAGAAVEGLGFVTKTLALRLGASWRTGPLSELPGSDTVVTAGAGGELWLLGAGGPASLGVRASALAIVHRVRSDVDSDGGRAETHDRWLPGGDLRIQSSLRLGSRAVWVLSAGAELAAGSTEIRKGSDRLVVATIPPVTLVGETGLRLMF
jgi:hypothetical protein